VTDQQIQEIEEARKVITKTVYDSESPESLDKLGFDMEWMSGRLMDAIKELIRCRQTLKDIHRFTQSQDSGPRPHDAVMAIQDMAAEALNPQQETVT